VWRLRKTKQESLLLSLDSGTLPLSSNPAASTPSNPQARTNSGERENAPRKRHRWSKKEKTRIDEHLDYAYGRKCFKEGPDCSGPLEHHHLDGNVENDHLQNLRWACRYHNRSLNKPAIRNVETGEKERMGDEVGGESSMEMKVNVDLRPRFEAWVGIMILKKKLTSREAIFAGAQYLREKWGHGSAVTTRRWLQELTSSTGPLQLKDDEQVGQFLQFKKDTPIKLAEWQRLAEWK